METAWQYWTGKIAAWLSKELGEGVAIDEIITPPDPTLGDFAFPCFRLAKQLKEAPVSVAKRLTDGFNASNQAEVFSVTAAGPYVNFSLKTGDVVHRVVAEIEARGKAYGTQTQKKSEPGILFEYANPNTHKEVHIGHLRNFILGTSLVRILQAAGKHVIPVSYINDVGVNVARVLWFLVQEQGFDVRAFSQKELQKLLTNIPLPVRSAKHLGTLYSEATVDVDTHPEKKAEVSFVQQQLEAHEPTWEALWQETRRWCLTEFSQIFDDLGVRIERQYFESDYLDDAQKIVDDLLQRGMARVSDGAIIMDLEDVKLGVALLRKTDGTLLYFPKDLALAAQKLRDYPEGHTFMISTDVRQSFYFKQLFEVLRRMGVQRDFAFFGYEIVTLPEGAMSSRKGNIITFQTLRDTVVDYARKEILARHPDWPEGKVIHAAWAIALAGMKFGMLKQDNDKIYTFDMEQSLAFDGATGPYCQYAVTRLSAILRKSKIQPSESAVLSRAFDHQSEKMLAMALAAFPRCVETAARDLRPSLVAQWCLDTAQKINEFYRDVPVLESKEDLLDGRLRLIAAARQVLSQGLDLLGIPLPDEM